MVAGDVRDAVAVGTPAVPALPPHEAGRSAGGPVLFWSSWKRSTILRTPAATVGTSSDD